MHETARYSRTAMALHWGIALLIAFNLGLGMRTEDLPRGAALFAVFQLHKSIGITVLLLSLWRLGIRIRGKGHPPPLEAHGVTAFLAQTVHRLFYVIMIGVPLSGWLIVSTGETRVPTLLYGLIPWPNLPVSGEGLHDASESVHAVFAQFGFPLLLFLHVAGAVRHQVLLKEQLVERMVPVRHAGLLTIAVLLASVFGAWAIGRWTPVAEALSGVSATPPQAPAPVRPPAITELPEADQPPADGEKTETQDEVEGDEQPIASTKWRVLPAGRLGFALTVSGQRVTGRFATWEAAIDLDPDKPEGGSIRASVDLASAASGDGERDTMMAGSDFFATSTHPRATFVSREVTRVGGNRYRARGTLTLKGVTKPLTLPFTLTVTGDTAKVSGEATLDRRSFNVGEGQFSGTDEVGGNVRVTVSFNARRA